MPHEPWTSRPASDSLTGIVAYCPTMAGPSRAIQISGSCPGLLGLRRYCHSQRRRLASAASCPNTRRYSASTARLSSLRYRSISATLCSRLCQHVLHVADQRVLRQRAALEPSAQGLRHPPDGLGRMQLFADDPEPGVGDLTAQSPDRYELEQVVK